MLGRLFRLLQGKRIVPVCCAGGESAARTLETAEVLAESDCLVLANLDIARQQAERELGVVDAPATADLSLASPIA